MLDNFNGVPKLDLLKESATKIKSGQIDVDKVTNSLIGTIGGVREKFGVDLRTLDEISVKMESQLPADWYDRWKKDEQGNMWSDASKQLLEKNGRLMRVERTNDSQRREILSAVSWIMVGRNVLSEESKRPTHLIVSGKSDDIEVVKGQFINDNQSREAIGVDDVVDAEVMNMNGEYIYSLLKPLMNTSSGGKDCVPNVVAWMLALDRVKKGDRDITSAMRDVSSDIESLRRNGGDDHFVPKGGGGWVTTIRYQNAIFENGRLRASDKNTLVNIYSLNSKGRAGDESETLLEKLRYISRNISVDGKFEMENIDTSPKYLRPGQLPENFLFEGKPVFAIRTATKMKTEVVIPNPKNDYFINKKYEHVDQCPRVGQSWELPGAHEVLLVDYDNDNYKIIDPQTGMLLQIDKSEFEERVNDGRIAFDKGICI